MKSLRSEERFDGSKNGQKTLPENDEKNSSQISKWASFLSWAEQMKDRIKTLSKLKKDQGKESLSPDPKDLLFWEQTRKFGFQFQRVPESSRWKTGITPDNQFLVSRNPDNNFLLIATFPKERKTAYSKNIRNYREIANQLVNKFADKLLLKDLKMTEPNNKIFDDHKLLVKEISGKIGAKEIPFKGNLFFFQTPTHFVGALGIFKENSSRFDDLLERMFRNMSVLPMKFFSPSRPKIQPAPTVQSETEKRETDSQPRLKIEQTPKKKPWELPETNESDHAPQDDSVNAIKSMDINEGIPEICKTCQGKSGCPKRCDRGYVVCKLCKANPPPRCAKCGGTGLRRVISSYTRLEIWDYCPACYGTGKKRCANKCLGGYLKCEFCAGRGVCPTCKGQGFQKR